MPCVFLSDVSFADRRVRTPISKSLPSLPSAMRVSFSLSVRPPSSVSVRVPCFASISSIVSGFIISICFLICARCLLDRLGRNWAPLSLSMEKCVTWNDVRKNARIRCCCGLCVGREERAPIRAPIPMMKTFTFLRAIVSIRTKCLHIFLCLPMCSAGVRWKVLYGFLLSRLCA